MADKTGIAWTDATWNPTTGCTKVSQGCKNCYAKHQAWPRLKASKGTLYFGREFEDVQSHPERLDWPYRRAQPSRIFVNSMSDLFHEDVPFEFIAQVFWIMSVTTRHKYQVLTKRPARMLEFFRWAGSDPNDPDDDGSVPVRGFEDMRIRQADVDVKWAPHREDGRGGGYDTCGPAFPYENVHLGVSVEDQPTADERIRQLLQVPAAVRFVSYEPALGPVAIPGFNSRESWCPRCCAIVPDSISRPHESIHGVDVTAPFDPTQHTASVYDMLHWVICGGESGTGARPMHPDWARSIRDQCADAGVPFFFKQWGEWAPGENCGYSPVRTERVAYWFDKDWTFSTLTPTQSAGMHRDDAPDLYRIGKKAAGNHLDGEVIEQWPK